MEGGMEPHTVPSWMMEWLGLSSIVLQQRETKNTNRNEGEASCLKEI